MQKRAFVRIATVAVAGSALVIAASPAHAQSSLSSDSPLAGTGLVSQYTLEQGLFSQHALALLGSQFTSDLTAEQKNALHYGPTSEDQARECQEKYDLDGDGPFPDIGIATDCSLEVIERDLYDEAVEIALESLNFSSSNGSSEPAPTDGTPVMD